MIPLLLSVALSNAALLNHSPHLFLRPLSTNVITPVSPLPTDWTRASITQFALALGEDVHGQDIIHTFERVHTRWFTAHVGRRECCQHSLDCPGIPRGTCCLDSRLFGIVVAQLFHLVPCQLKDRRKGKFLEQTRLDQPNPKRNR